MIIITMFRLTVLAPVHLYLYNEFHHGTDVEDEDDSPWRRRSSSRSLPSLVLPSPLPQLLLQHNICADE